jgi:GNAT superfamily N-acetyltransferase
MSWEKLATVRPGAATDLGVIYSSWLKGLYYGNDWFREIDQELYFDRYHQAIEAILFRPTTLVRVMALNDDSDVVLGYSVSDGDRLHWVYVRPAWRKLGIAKAIIPAGISKVTHLTKVGRSLKPKKWAFDPF